MPSEDSKPLKKEEVEEDDKDENSLGSILRDKSKKNPVSASKLPKPKKEENLDFHSSQKKPISKPVKVKKVENPTSDSDDDKPIAKKPIAKDDKSKIKNKKKEEMKKKKNEAEAKKRERKVYDLPGQKRDPPEERDPLRIFYETLYEQVPDSEIAAIWMMESGLLPEDIAKKVYGKKQKKSQLQRLGSPMKAVSATKKVTQSKSLTVRRVKDSSLNSANKSKTTTVTTVKTKKRKKDESSEEEDSEDEFVISKVVKKQKA